MPKTFLGKNWEEVGPKHAGENPRDHSQYETGGEGPCHGSRSSASTGGDIKQRRNRKDGKGIAERSFNQQRDLDFAPQVYLLQDRQNDGTADAAEDRTDQERVEPRKTQC